MVYGGEVVCEVPPCPGVMCVHRSVTLATGGPVPYARVAGSDNRIIVDTRQITTASRLARTTSILRVLAATRTIWPQRHCYSQKIHVLISLSQWQWSSTIHCNYDTKLRYTTLPIIGLLTLVLSVHVCPYVNPVLKSEMETRRNFKFGGTLRAYNWHPRFGKKGQGHVVPLSLSFETAAECYWQDCSMVINLIL